MRATTLTLMAFLTFPMAQQAMAGETSSTYTEDMTEDQLRSDLWFPSEMLVMSEDGSRLYRIEEAGGGSFGSSVGFNVKVGGQPAQVWVKAIMDARGLGVKFTKKTVDRKQVLDEQVMRFKDLTSVTYEAGRYKGRKLVVRVSAVLQKEPVARDFSEFSLTLKDAMLIRNSEEVLESGLGIVSPSGRIGMYTEKTGTLRIGLRKFPGAEPIGVIEGRTLRFSFKGDRYKWVSDEPILGPGRWIAWIQHDDKKPEDGVGAWSE